VVVAFGESTMMELVISFCPSNNVGNEKKKEEKKRQTNNKKLLMNHITCKVICNIMGLQYCGSCKRNFG
jgi:hypothetical protein